MKEKASQFLKNKSYQRTVFYIICLLVWAGLSLIASQFIVALIMVPILGDTITQPLWMAVYDLLSYSLALALVIFLPPKIAQLVTKDASLSKALKINITEMGVDKWPTFVDIGLVPVGYVLYIFFANLATSLMQSFTWFDAEEAQDVGFSGLLSGSDRIFAMLALVFIAPIVEELVMRGWLYGKLRAKLKAVPAILLTSLLFAVLHGQWNVGVSVFFLSIILCSLREITGSIWSGILLHMLNNGVAFYILYILGL